MKYFQTKEAKLANITPLQAPNHGDAGYDLRAAEEVVLNKGVPTKVKTGIHIEIPDGFVGIIKDRSSMASKGVYTHGGVIDSSYRGEIVVVLSNEFFDVGATVKPNDKIAQLVIVPIYVDRLEEVGLEELSDTNRGVKGFGSTGV